MSIDSLIYLSEIYWPFLLAALLIGLATGWLTYSAPAKTTEG
jgi:hypothetical protein